MIFNKKTIILICGIFFVGILSGIFIGLFKGKNDIKEETAKIPLEIINKRNITILYANASGIVINKQNNNSKKGGLERNFTLKKGQHQAIIYIDDKSKNLTSFYQVVGTNSAEMNFLEIAIGDSVEGGVSIFVNKENVEKILPFLVAHRFKVSKTK